MRRIAAVFLWDLGVGLQNRFLQVFALACVAGGAGLLAAAPGRDVLPLLLIQVILFFGSLFALLIGWGSGQQARGEGPFLFAQPLGADELIAGKLLGIVGWCVLLLALLMGPAAFQAGIPAALATLAGLALAFLLVCITAGLLMGLLASPVTGLLAALLAWGVSVAGWEVGLLLLAEVQWVRQTPALFLGLLLVNPAGLFRIASMVGIEAVPFDAAEMETGRFLLRHIVPFAMAGFAAWLVALLTIGVWRVGRQEF